MDFMQAFSGNGGLGEMPLDGLAELRKALTADYGTDVAQLTGGGALRVQSLEQTLLSTIQDNQDFRLFNALAKSNALGTVDEWSEQQGVGGVPGGSFNSEQGTIAGAQGDYRRRTGFVKYLMTRRQVSLVLSLQSAIADAEAVEATNGALQLLTDAELCCFEGDSTVIPLQFDGIYKQVNDNAPGNIIDLRGQPIDSIISVNKGAQIIRQRGNFGQPTDLFLSTLAQTDLDNHLDPAFRVQLTDNKSAVAIGAPVEALRTSFGTIKNQPDVFIRDEEYMVPFELLFPAPAAANIAFKPATVAVADAGQTAGSNWQAQHAGQFYYAVTGINTNGESPALVSAEVTVGAGEAVAITITPSASRTETGYVIYRSRLGGTNALTDLREMIKIPATGAPSGANTVFIDLNNDFPGATKAYMLNNKPGQKAINWRQLLPMMKFQLYPTDSAILPWAQLLFGYLRLGKARQHVVYKNLVSASQVWLPFN